MAAIPKVWNLFCVFGAVVGAVHARIVVVERFLCIKQAIIYYDVYSFCMRLLLWSYRV